MSKETIQELIERHVIDNSGQWNHEADEAWILAGQGQFKITREEFNSAADRLRGKPDWKDAPDWACWIAQSNDGKWHWYPYYVDEPVAASGYFLNKARACCAVASAGKLVGDWRNTLEKRPEQKVEPAPAKPWFEAGELPPVGSTEADCKIKGKAYEQIKAFKVLAHENGKAVIASYHNEREHWAEFEGYYKRPVNFTPYVISKPYFLPIEPIKTEREKSIEAAVRVCTGVNIATTTDSLTMKTLNKLYDAGLLRLPEQK